MTFDLGERNSLPAEAEGRISRSIGIIVGLVSGWFQLAFKSLDNEPRMWNDFFFGVLFLKFNLIVLRSFVRVIYHRHLAQNQLAMTIPVRTF